MYFETIREQPAPPPIKGVKIELSLDEARSLHELLLLYNNFVSFYSKHVVLRDTLLENLKGIY